MMAVHRLFVLAFAALPFLATDATAQDAGRYRTWDRNNDGIITRAEWRGTAQDFRARDVNRDGMLSGTEVRDQRTATINERTATINDRWDTNEWDTNEEWDADTFATLDRNRNGRIARAEWRGDLATFRRVDRNRDNQITRAEFLNANAGYDVDVTDFDGLDYNNNERLERAEWNGTRPTFDRLDVNRDGWLSRSELSANDVVDSPITFDAVDSNNNGVITRGEWPTASGNFNQHDRNRDGVISRAEYSMMNSDTAMQTAVIVDSRQPWTNSGLYVTAGDVITYRAEGTIQMSTNGNDRATAAGSLSGRSAQNSPRPDQRAGGLLLRLGNGSVAYLGENGTFTAQNSGQLYLGVNDDHFADNTGEYRVTLSISQR